LEPPQATLMMRTRKSKLLNTTLVITLAKTTSQRMRLTKKLAKLLEVNQSDPACINLQAGFLFGSVQLALYESGTY